MRVWDAIVVGAGPAGAMASLGLARRGARVLLLERSPFPRWKVCGACLSAGSRDVLEAEGLDAIVSALGGTELRSFRLHAPARRAALPLMGSAAVSRSVFDAALVRAAEDAGASFWPEARVTATWLGAGRRHLRVVRSGAGEVLAARVVVDATGLGGGVRDQGSSPDQVADGSRIGLGGVLRAEQYPVEPEDLHMSVGPGGYVGLVRTEDGTLNVAAALDPRVLRESTAAAAVSRVLTRAGMPPIREQPLRGWRGTPPLTRTSQEVGAERLFRVGDAAGYVEPFTGEGICWALSGGRAVAVLAARGVEEWGDDLLERWRIYHARALGRAQHVCRALAGALRRPWLVRAGMAALELAPGVAAPFLTRVSRAPAELRA